jgi:hypothetical protein
MQPITGNGIKYRGEETDQANYTTREIEEAVSY